MRHLLPTSLALALVLVALAGAAGLATAEAATGTPTGKPKAHAAKPAVVKRTAVASPAVVAAVARYRQLTWTYDRIAHLRRLTNAMRLSVAMSGIDDAIGLDEAEEIGRVAIDDLREIVSRIHRERLRQSKTVERDRNRINRLIYNIALRGGR